MTDHKLPLDIRHICSTREFESLKEPWNELLAQNHVQLAILSWEWLYSWWQAFQHNHQLRIITAYRSTQLVGIAPLMLVKRGKLGLNLRVLCTLGTPMNDIGAFLIHNRDTQIINQLTNHLIENRGDWDVLELHEFSETGPEIEAIRNVLSNVKSHQIQVKTKHYYLPVGKDWDAYFGTLSKNFRKNIRRSTKSLNASGSVSIQHISGSDLKDEHIDALIAVNRYAHYPRLYQSKNEQSFLRALFTRASRWLNVFMISIDEQPVAYKYGFTYNRRYESWRTGFDTRIDPGISIGKLLTLEVIKHAFKNGLNEIDFMRGVGAHKQSWKPLEHEFVSFRIFNQHSFLARFAYYWLKTIKPLIKTILTGKHDNTK